MTGSAPRWIGIDGDDTLWHSEVGFQAVESAYVDILSKYVDPTVVSPALLKIEVANLSVYGYGVKAMMLSMLENALQLTDGTLTSADTRRVLELGRWLLEHPVELLDEVAETVPCLALDYELLLITKGDLLHQEHKVEQSGLAQHFVSIEIVSEKNPERYAAVLRQHNIAPAEFVMVGNSLRSDIAPVLDLGARAVHVPHGVTWAAEQLSADAERELAQRVPVLESFGELPNVLRGWGRP